MRDSSTARPDVPHGGTKKKSGRSARNDGLKLDGKLGHYVRVVTHFV